MHEIFLLLLNSNIWHVSADRPIQTYPIQHPRPRDLLLLRLITVRDVCNRRAALIWDTVENSFNWSPIYLINWPLLSPYLLCPLIPLKVTFLPGAIYFAWCMLIDADNVTPPLSFGRQLLAITMSGTDLCAMIITNVCPLLRQWLQKEQL